MKSLKEAAEHNPNEDEKLENLRVAIQAGFDSGVTEGDPFVRVLKRLREKQRE
jgi:hypothetical protein